MYAPRLTSNGFFYTQGSSGIDKYIFAVGGNQTKDCERYSVMHGRWELVPSFREQVECESTGLNNFLFTYTMCSTSLV